MSLPAWLRVHPDGVVISLKVQPRASRNEVAGPIGRVLTHRAILKAIWGPNAVDHPEHLRVLVASGHYDLGTPYSASNWSLAQLDVPQRSWRGRPGFGGVVGTWGELQHSADRLDPEAVTVLVDVGDHFLVRPSSSVAKKTDADLRISFARRNS